MSAVKIFALGVLMTGAFATTTPAGSMPGDYGSQPAAPGQKTTAPTSLVFAQAPRRIVAAENLAGGWAGYGSSSTGGSLTLGSLTTGEAPQGNSLFLGTSQQPSPINFGGASFRLANSVAGATQSPPSPVPASSPALPLPSPAPAVSSPSPAPSSSPDAFINFGNAPYAEASSLTTGNPQPFTSSSAFTSLYGSRGPSSQDVSHFENQVISTVQKTYNAAGLPIHLTLDPNASAAHSLSVVSGASNPQSPGAIGITDVGNNGFSFIDKFGSAQTPDQLATAVGHNVAHELMHAFGLANHPETNGPYVDAATTTFASLSDPNTTFSPAASSLLSTLNFQATGQSVTTGNQNLDGNQMLAPDAAPVPEPSAIALWTLAGLSALAYRRRKRSA